MKRIRNALFIFLVFVLATCISVSAATVKRTITIKKKTSTVKATITVGDNLKLTVKSGKKAISYKKIKFSTSKKAVATVSKKGVISAKKPGKAVITLKYKHTNKKTYTTKITVTVVQPVKSVKLNKNDITLTVGDKYTLSPTITPSNATNKAVYWDTLNFKIADVSDKGVVTAKGVEKTVISVTTDDGDKTDSCTVTVKKNLNFLKKVRLNS